MPEWSTYSLSDFLMFAPRTYYRLLELYNRDLWPAHVAVIAGGLAVIVLAAARGGVAGPAQYVALAAAWAWVGWGWLHRRLATIDWSATGFAVGFALEAAMLLIFAATCRPGVRRSRGQALAGTALALAATVGYPLLAPAAGRDLATAEVVGLAPDPTVIATLGLLANGTTAMRWLLLPVPLAWCAVSGATLWTMATPTWWVPPLAAVVAMAIVALPAAGAAVTPSGARRNP